MPSLSNIEFVWLCFGVILLGKESCSLKSMVIKVPEAVKSGDTVTLSCEYDLENVPLYSIRWYWNDEEFYRYVPKESPPYKAFPVKLVNVDFSKSGPTAVTVRGVHRELTGDYKCEVTSDGPFFHTEILLANMIVAEIPQDEPILSLRDTKDEGDKKLNIDCLSIGSWPEANLTWFINNKKILNNSTLITIIPTIIVDSESGLKTAKSRIEIIKDKSTFPQGVMALKCEASMYNIWQSKTEKIIRDESPELAQVLGSTLSQSQLDPLAVAESSSNPIWKLSTFGASCYVCVISCILKIVFR